MSFQKPYKPEEYKIEFRKLFVKYKNKLTDKNKKIKNLKFLINSTKN